MLLNLALPEEKGVKSDTHTIQTELWGMWNGMEPKVSNLRHMDNLFALTDLVLQIQQKGSHNYPI